MTEQDKNKAPNLISGLELFILGEFIKYLYYLLVYS